MPHPDVSDITYEQDNLRFLAHTIVAMPSRGSFEDRYLLDVTRISDGHHVGRQVWLTHLPTDEEMPEVAAGWIWENPGLSTEPEKVHCLACGITLRSETDTDYQFDNALWLSFHGGYGMFVDNLDVKWPTNSEEQWLRDEDGQPVLEEGGIVRDPTWAPEYEEKRVLPGRPDHEAVICHECAHKLCETVPWLHELLRPQSSHAHHYADHDRLRDEGHVGWDLKEQV